MKNSLKVLAGVAAAALMLGSSPAYAFTPTLSEVRVLPGPDAGESWLAAALTPDGNTALTTDGMGLWVDNLVTGSSVEVTPALTDAGALLIDATGTFAYVPEATGSYPTYTYQIRKIDIASATVVATWTDPDLTTGNGQMEWAPDGASFYIISESGSYPAFQTTLFNVNVSSGAVTSYTSGEVGYFQRFAAVDQGTGTMFIPQNSTNTGATEKFLNFDMSTNTFSTVAYAGTGEATACAFASGVLACVFDDTIPHVATFDAAGAVTGTLNLDPAVDGVEAFALSPDGTQGFAFGQASGSFCGIQIIDMTTLTSVSVLDTLLDYANFITPDPTRQAMWFTADYIADYDGGYQVLTYAEAPSPSPSPALPNTGVDTSAAMMAATGFLFAGLSVVAIVAIRRRRA